MNVDAKNSAAGGRGMIPTTESGRLFPGGRIDKGSDVCYNLVTSVWFY